MILSNISIKPWDAGEVQARLDAIPGAMSNTFNDNHWKFEGKYGRIVNIYFNDLLNMGDKYPNWPISKTYDWVLITKLMWLSLNFSTTSNMYLVKLRGIKLVWAAMAYCRATKFSKENCSEILSFLLMNSWGLDCATKNSGIKSYGSYNAGISLIPWKISLSKIEINIISSDVTEREVEKCLRNLIPTLTTGVLTYRDWIQGGSLDLLTLDHGRYYVEHCFSFFEKQYPLAFTLASIYKNSKALAVSLDYKPSTVINVLSIILRGESPEEIKERWPSWSLSTLQKIHSFVKNQFMVLYQKARYEASLLQDSTLKPFIVVCGLQQSQENIDRMRVIIWDWLNRKDRAETQILLDECQPSVLWADFEKQLRVVKYDCDQKPITLPSGEDFLQIGLVEHAIRASSNTYPRQLVRLVAGAGLTSVIALTGWRKSEYGFSHSAIKRTRNDDKLDQYAFPWRYQVDWYVYKTTGKVRQLREITFSTILITERLQLLFNANSNQPCLYEVSTTNNDFFDSRSPVQRSVRILWGHFVKHYQGFKQLDDLEKIQSLNIADSSGESLTQEEQGELDQLLTQRSLNEWAQLSIDPNLKNTRQRVREEWPRMNFFFQKSTNKDKNNWLVRYRERTLRSDWIQLLDSHLTEEIKNWIQSIPIEQLRSKQTSKKVIECSIENTIHPVPHAFRHMWAEAVYRRFDGDAGWMIRSQFKHISRTMWLAYIRDKDNRHSHEQVKVQVTSSLVHNYLRHQGEGYTGQLHTWLRRLLKKTTVMTPQEQEKFVERLATVEIENIKANPWGYCLLKRRTRNKAKCAEMGEPMRHNASPDLCLGCTHNLMQTENVEWTLLHATSHVEALRNPVVPAIFKESSYKLVKNVSQHVRTLNPNHEALTELQRVLDNYIAERIV